MRFEDGIGRCHSFSDLLLFVSVSTLSRSMAVSTISAILLAAEGMPYIGEPVSQRSHALQAAQLASLAGADEETVAAALLHDIGHLPLPLAAGEEAPNQMGEFGVAHHEDVGAKFLLRMGFSERVAKLVRSHVRAKRYLVATDAQYAAKLSDASKVTLEHQGGPFTEKECEEFRDDPDFDTMLLMRIWDESAKDSNWKGPPIDFYVPLLRRCIGEH